MGHRRFLDGKHRFMLQRNHFNGQQEKRGPPRNLSGEEIIEQLVDVEFVYGKKDDPANAGTKMARASGSVTQQWQKISVFFTLPYWTDNLL